MGTAPDQSASEYLGDVGFKQSLIGLRYWLLLTVSWS